MLFSFVQSITACGNYSMLRLYDVSIYVYVHVTFKLRFCVSAMVLGILSVLRRRNPAALLVQGKHWTPVRRSD